MDLNYSRPPPVQITYDLITYNPKPLASSSTDQSFYLATSLN